MKMIIKIIVIVFAVIFSGCWNMYNDVLDDLDDDYNFFLAVVNTGVSNTGFISTFSFDSEGGINYISKTSGFTNSGCYPAVSPDGNYLYVPVPDDDLLKIYSLNNNGSLNFLSEKATGNTPMAATVHPSGKYVYVSNYVDRTISMYKVNSNGSLEDRINIGPIGTYPVPTLMEFHPSGNYLYSSADIDGTPPGNVAYFLSFPVDSATGLLSTPEVTTITTSTDDRSTLEVKIHPNGRYLYITLPDNNDEELYKYNLNSNGSIDLTSTPVPYSLNSTWYNYFAIHPSGNFLYCTTSSSVRSYRINLSDGALTQINAASTGSTVNFDLIIHPNGKHIYSVGQITNQYIFRYNTNNDGSVSFIESIAENGDYLNNQLSHVLIKKKIK